MKSTEHTYIAKAFVSCSLRDADRFFVDFVCQLLRFHRIEPFGTVGMLDVSPENPSELMRRNIDRSDIVVVIATSRYFSQDKNTLQNFNSISEMVHAEAGMAYAKSKPLVVIVQEGTHVGNFIPTITNYVTLDGTIADLTRKRVQINSLLRNACDMAENHRIKQNWKDIGNFAWKALAFYGGLRILGLTGGNDEDYDDEYF